MRYRRYRRHRGSSSDDSGMGCIALIILALIAMPLVGLYLAFKGKDDGMKLLGVVLTIVGIIIWIAAY